MENERSFDYLVVKVAELHKELQGLSQTQIGVHIKEIFRLNTPQHWDAFALKDEMDFFFDEQEKNDETCRYLCPCINQ